MTDALNYIGKNSIQDYRINIDAFNRKLERKLADEEEEEEEVIRKILEEEL